MNRLTTPFKPTLPILAAMLSVGSMLLLSACQTAPTYSQAALNAIETRNVDASTEDTFSAASGALFDSGYTIAMSDRAAGLLTGSRAKDNSSTRRFWNPAVEDVRFLLSVQIRSVDSKRSVVRIKTSVNGEPTVDKEAIDKIWVLMQRQVLMTELPAMPADQITKPAGKAE